MVAFRKGEKMGNREFKNTFLISAGIFLADCIVIYLSNVISQITALHTINFYFLMVYAAFYGIIAFNLDMYSVNNKKRFDILLSITIAAVIASAAALFFDYFLFNPHAYLFRLQYLSFYLVVYLMMLVWRLTLQHLIKKSRAHAKLLVIEEKNMDNALARKIKYSCLDWFDSWYTQVDSNDPEAIEEFIRGEFSQYDNIFITQTIPEQARKRLVAEAIRTNKEIYMLPSLYDINITKYDMVQFDDTPSFRIRPFRLTPGQRVTKRGFDFVCSLLGMVIASPLFLLVSIAIKLDSKGPVFYTQERVTRDGKCFHIYKFRTMRADAEKLSGPVLASDDDPRITRVGKALRLTRLDELPQLINILTGDMSIVGPRPERPFFVEKFCEEIEDYDKRHAVKAGLTGYAQVYARYDTDATDKLLYDLLYIREYSLALDLRIILLTIKTMFDKEASGGVKEKPDWSKPKTEALPK